MPDNGKTNVEAALYPLLDQLDRLEDLLEEMDDLRVSCRADVERRMAELNDEIDRLSGA